MSSNKPVKYGRGQKKSFKMHPGQNYETSASNYKYVKPSHEFDPRQFITA